MSAPSLSAGALDAPIVRALPLHCHLQGSAPRAAVKLVCMVTFPSSQGRCHFGVAGSLPGLLQDQMRPEPFWKDSCQVGLVGWSGPRSIGEHRGRHCGVSKLGGRCSHWFPQVSSCLGWRAGREKWCPQALLFLEKSPKDPCPSSTCSVVNK